MHDPDAIEHESLINLWDRWLKERREIIAPSLLRYEVTNALFRSVRYGLTPPDRAQLVFRSLALLPIRYFDEVALNQAAFEIANQLSLKAAYDAHYLALARQEDAELYTVDRRLVNSAQSRYPFVRYAMDIQDAGN